MHHGYRAYEQDKGANAGTSWSTKILHALDWSSVEILFDLANKASTDVPFLIHILNCVNVSLFAIILDGPSNLGPNLVLRDLTRVKGS